MIGEVTRGGRNSSSGTLARIPIPVSRPAFPCSYPRPPAGRTTRSSPDSAPRGAPPRCNCRASAPSPASPFRRSAPTPRLLGGEDPREEIGARFPVGYRLRPRLRRIFEAGRTRSTSSPTGAILTTRIVPWRGTRDASERLSRRRPRRRHRRRRAGGRSAVLVVRVPIADVRWRILSRWRDQS